MWPHARYGILAEVVSERGNTTALKPAYWMGSSRADVRKFPEEVKDEVGYALYVAQDGGKHASAQPMRGFGGAGVVEIIEDHEGSTYRTVYTVRFARTVYVLHAFQKKSKKGAQTPKPDMELIKTRLAAAEKHYRTEAGPRLGPTSGPAHKEP